MSKGHVLVIELEEYNLAESTDAVVSGIAHVLILSWVFSINDGFKSLDWLLKYGEGANWWSFTNNTKAVACWLNKSKVFWEGGDAL